MSSTLSETACSPGQPQDDPLDREYLNKNYLALGCGDVLADVCKIYLDSAPQKLEQIRQFLGQGELEPVVRLAHGLKGESGSIGGRFVMATAAALEKAARSGELAEAIGLLPELELQLQHVATVIQKEFVV